MALGTSHRLQEGIESVETMTRFAFAILALASGAVSYTHLTLPTNREV